MSNKTSEHMKRMNLSAVKNYGYVYETDKIVCPYCGEQWDMDYEDYARAPYEDMESQCPECKEYFLLSCEPVTEFNFVSRKYDEVTEC